MVSEAAVEKLIFRAFWWFLMSSGVFWFSS